MRKLILSLFITIVCASAVQAQSTFYTVPQLEEAMNGDRIIAFWTYLHKQGSSNLALKGIRLDSLMIAMDSMIGSGGGGSGPDYYQTIRLNGVNANQRQALNFVNNPGVFQFNVTDDSGSGETEVTGTVTGLDLTSSSTAIIVTNGAGTTLKNTQLDLDPSQIILSTLGGELDLTQISDGGAATGDVLQWNGTAWVPADVSGGGGSYVAGAGIDITGVIISNTGDLLITNEGDLAVIEDSPTQVSLVSNTSGSTNVLIVQGDGIDVTADELTNTLTVTNTGDTDASDDLTDATIFDGDVTGTYNNLQIEPGAVGTPELADGAVTMVKINQAGATSGQVIKWNGSAWAPAADATGGSGGFYETLQEEGVDLTQRDKINFIGSSAAATDDGANNRTNVTFDTDLNALADIATTGVYVITASGTSITRTITAGTGISVTNGSGVGGNPTITNTGDLSATNELQIFTNSSDATNHYLVLSDGGGSITFTEGSGITLTTTGTGDDGIVTIAATGGGSSNYQLIRDDGVDMTTRPNANFVSTVDITFNLDDDAPNSETEIEADIPADAVDFAEMQNIATNTLIGRSTAGTGDPESITVSTGLSLSGGNLTATDASTTNEIQDLSITGVSSPFTLDISGSANDVNFAAGTGITLSESPANTLVIASSVTDTRANIEEDNVLVLTNSTANDYGAGLDVAIDGSEGDITLDLSEVTEQVQDNSWNVLGGTQTGITVTYNDAGNNVSFVATDASATNELQTITNSSDATSHTATLSNTGGSIQFVEGSGISLTTTGTAADGIVTIAATGGGASNYQLFRDDGVDATVRPNANFVSNSDIAFTLTDDGANTETELTADIPAQAVDFAEIQNVSTGTLAGRSTAGSGSLEQITVSTGLSISGGNLTATDASTTNEVLTISDGTDSEAMGGQTLTVSGASGITADYVPATNTLTISGIGASAYQTIQEEGTGVTQRAIFNFVGSTATAADDGVNSRTNVTFDSDVNALASTASTGAYVITGVGTSATRTLTGPAAGITVTNGNGVSGNPTLALANDLSALEGLAGTGIPARTAADTWALRTITAGSGITVSNGSGATGNPTIDATDPSLSNEGSLTVVAGGANDSQIKSNTSGSTNITISGLRGLLITESGSTITAALPTGTTHYGLRFNGTDWVSSAQLQNNDTEIGIGGAPIAGIELYVNGRGRFDATIESQGVGVPTGSANAAAVRLINTTAITGDTWYLGSLNDGTFALQSGNAGSVLTTETDGTVATVYDLKIGDVTGITPTTIIGRDASGYVGTIAVGSGLSLAGGTLSATGGGGTNYQTIQEEGVAVTQRAIFNFVGSTATAADNVTKTDITFDSDVNALASTASTGLYAITGTGTSATRTLTAPAAGITVSNGNGVSGNPTLALANDLSALEGLAGTGIGVRTAADTWTNRSVVAGTGAVTITNGDGVSGNITINNTDPDQSTTNEVVTISDGTDSEAMGGQTLTVSGAGGITADYVPATNTLTITGAASGNYQTIQEEGTGVTQRATFNFVGSSATAADDVPNTRTNITFDSDLNALASTAATGLYAITGVGTSATRTLTAPAAGITVTNGNGVSGNPTLALANDLSALEGLAGTGIGVRTAADTWTNRSVVAGTGAVTVTNGNGVAGNITINNTDPDQSTTNEVVTISDGVNSEAMGGQTLIIAGAGINVATYNGVSNTVTITGNEVDGSTTNELQNITSSSDATSHTITLSSSGGTFKLVEGSNITLTTSGTAADGIVTIASTGGGGGTPAGADFQVQYYNGGAFGAEAAFNYNPTLNRLVVGHTSATAVLHARGADDVADRAFLAENFSANDILTIFTTGRTKWGDNETYPYVYQAPSAGGTASYTANGLSFESDLVATTGVDLFSFKNQTSTNSTGGPYSIVRSTGTWAPTSGSAIYNSITANPTINATSTASGKANMFNGTPTITQASGGVNIFNAAPTVTAASGGLRGYYSDIASGTGIYQLFMDGTAQSRFDGVVGIKTDAAAGYDLHVTGPTRVDATIESRGTGTPTGGTAAAAVRLINTGGGDTWYLGSVSTGEFVLQSGNSSTVLTGEADGTIKTTYDFRIGDVTGITPTTVIGRDADGDVGTVTLGSGVVLSAGELPLWNSNDAGAITSITTTALVDVTGLSFAVTANKKYEFWAVIQYSAAATTTGSAWSINGPAGTVSLHVESGLTNNTSFGHWQNAVNTVLASASSAYTVRNIAYVRGIVEPTAGGTYIIRGGTEVGGSAITVQGASNINWREIK